MEWKTLRAQKAAANKTLKEVTVMVATKRQEIDDKLAAMQVEGRDIETEKFKSGELFKIMCCDSEKLDSLTQKYNEITSEGSNSRKNSARLREFTVDCKRNIAALKREVEAQEIVVNRLKRTCEERGFFNDGGVSSSRAVNGELLQAQEELRAINEQIRDCQRQQNLLGSQKEELSDNSQRMKAEMEMLERELREMDSVKSQRWQSLLQNSRNKKDLEAVRKYIATSRGVFKEAVYDPVCIEINVKDTKQADLVEAIIGEKNLSVRF